VEKGGLNIWATSVILKKKLPEVNNAPRGENSPNLVALLLKIHCA
jgi:hypothetical protein